MKRLGYTRMIFMGEDGSMGYTQGREYALEIKSAGFFQRFVLGYSFWIFDMNGEGQPCPYSSIITFLMNWQQI